MVQKAVHYWSFLLTVQIRPNRRVEAAVSQRFAQLPFRKSSTNSENDPRYTFYQFPVRPWTAEEADFDALLHGPSEAVPIAQAAVRALVDQSADLAAAEVLQLKNQIEARL